METCTHNSALLLELQVRQHRTSMVSDIFPDECPVQMSIKHPYPRAATLYEPLMGVNSDVDAPSEGLE